MQIFLIIIFMYTILMQFFHTEKLCFLYSLIAMSLLNIKHRRILEQITSQKV